MMSSSNPVFALAYVRELSADFVAGVVLGETRPEAGGEAGDAGPAGGKAADGGPAGDEAAAVLAGAPALERPARALLAAHPHARALHGVAQDGTQVFAARVADRAIVVVTGPLALPALMRRDLRTALSGNAAETVQEAPLERPDEALVEALATAVADVFRP